MTRTRSEGESSSNSRRIAARAKLAVISSGAKEKIGFTPLHVFRYEFFKDFFKNRNVAKDKASIDAFLETAANRWNSLSDTDKAPYVARSLVLTEQHNMATSTKASNLADMLGNMKI